MEELRQQQIEALQVVHEYTERLIKGIENVSAELNGARKLDTDAYLKEVINGLNWVIEIVNRTMDVINEGGVCIDKATVNNNVVSLGEALKKNDDAAIAAELSGNILSFVKDVWKATEKF